MTQGKDARIAALEAKLAEVRRIADDYQPDNLAEAFLALQEMRDALLSALEATPPAPKVTEQQAELLRRLVMPMVAERSREVGDAWDKAYHVLDALTAAQESGE